MAGIVSGILIVANNPLMTPTSTLYRSSISPESQGQASFRSMPTMMQTNQTLA